MPDRTLLCVDCKAQFQFTEGEQKWFTEKGFKDPKRCRPCRDARKQGEPKQDQQRG